MTGSDHPALLTEADVIGDLDPTDVRVRFPPSPTGNLHVGNVRSALFNWAFARHYGGSFVLRIEDTDTARNTEGSLEGLIAALRWLGLDWDEGPDKEGPHGPYIQSERGDIYADGVTKLLAGGHAYRCFCTREEIDARQQAQGKSGPSGYDGFCRELTAGQVAEKQAAGIPAVIRMRIPDGSIDFLDLVRGPVHFDAEHVPDYVIVRADGSPLYTLVNPVDDALMEITHVLRGEDLLSSTPRQIVMYRALAEIGVGPGRTPKFGHLPTVLGEGNRRLSKRDKGSGLQEYQLAGYLPEGLLNYLALLGWAIADDRDVFGMDEMVQAFDIRRVNANPARFDPKKCEAINAAHIRLLDPADLTARLTPYLIDAGVLAEPPEPEQLELLSRATPLVQERINTLSESVALLDFLFLDDDQITIADDAGLKPDALPVLEAAESAITGLDQFDHDQIEIALRTALIDGLGMKPRKAFGPVRAAISGKRISPPLFESMELLGRESSLSRIGRAKAYLGPQTQG
ncbi:glutamate--tRNA ligase [Microlunatus elymi]|uniref:glutamate--tRNA ligase n=1 Tax=Microlunatus elymi TaxID=2596828 RepID=UPI0038994575